VRLDPARLYGVLPGAEAEKYTISDCLLTTAPTRAGRQPLPKVLCGLALFLFRHAGSGPKRQALRYGLPHSLLYNTARNTIPLRPARLHQRPLHRPASKPARLRSARGDLRTSRRHGHYQRLERREPDGPCGDPDDGDSQRGWGRKIRDSGKLELWELDSGGGKKLFRFVIRA